MQRSNESHAKGAVKTRRRIPRGSPGGPPEATARTPRHIGAPASVQSAAHTCHREISCASSGPGASTRFHS
eukprot:4083562-Pyramimonas_sp.AAC.1